ncbi:MAG: CBS domain-containing protein [Thermodesulfobacteriota bacterium]
MPLSLRVWDFMDRNFQTIGPDATLGEAMEVMSEAAKTAGHTRSLVVVDKQMRPLGVLSMRNILEAFKPEFVLWSSLLGQDGWAEALEKGFKQCHYRRVEDYMVQVPALKMSDDLIKAFRVLTERKLEVRMVPVVEAEKVEGVVRIPELFEAFVQAYRKMAT